MRNYLMFEWKRAVKFFFTNRSISKQVVNYKLDIQIKDRNSRKTYIGWTIPFKKGNYRDVFNNINRESLLFVSLNIYIQKFIRILFQVNYDQVKEETQTTKKKKSWFEQLSLAKTL